MKQLAAVEGEGDRARGDVQDAEENSNQGGGSSHDTRSYGRPELSLQLDASGQFGAPPQEPQQSMMCLCNQPAEQYSVRKEGPRKGRTFWRCAQGQCNCFHWDLLEQPNRAPKRPQRPPRTVGHGGPIEHGTWIACDSSLGHGLGDSR